MLPNKVNKLNSKKDNLEKVEATYQAIHHIFESNVLPQYTIKTETLKHVSPETIISPWAQSRVVNNIIIPRSHTLRHYLKRPDIEAVYDLANVGDGFQCCGVDGIGLGIVKYNKTSGTLTQSPYELLI